MTYRSCYFYKSFILVRVKGLEPSRRETPDSKSGASANSAIPAKLSVLLNNNIDF